LKLELTGERVVPALMNPKDGMLKEHLARYQFSARFACGRTLDIACGAGYGLEIIRQQARQPVTELVGVDIDKETIDYAIQHYWEEGLDFLEGDIHDLSLKDKVGTFDTIVCLETIEHVENDQRAIENLAALLNPGGLAIVSTPFGQGRGKPCSNPFHVHQYLVKEFTEILKPLGKLAMYYQRDITIEKQKLGKKYYLMVAVCQNL
jgi:2-polyprenyl-3-methyl-5-hydroxy-6-metoxy-1,4-benzoquinol methylase